MQSAENTARGGKKADCHARRQSQTLGRADLPFLRLGVDHDVAAGAVAFAFEAETADGGGGGGGGGGHTFFQIALGVVVCGCANGVNVAGSGRPTRLVVAIVWQGRFVGASIDEMVAAKGAEETIAHTRGQL